MKTRFTVEEHDYESGAWQQRVNLPMTIAKQANSPRFQSFVDENENVSKSLPNLLYSEFRRQSNTNSESSKSTVFRIVTNQTHPMTSV